MAITDSLVLCPSPCCNGFVTNKQRFFVSCGCERDTYLKVVI